MTAYQNESTLTSIDDEPVVSECSVLVFTNSEQMLRQFEENVERLTALNKNFSEIHGRVLTFKVKEASDCWKGIANFSLYPHALMEVLEACLQAAEQPGYRMGFNITTAR